MKEMQSLLTYFRYVSYVAERYAHSAPILGAEAFVAAELRRQGKQRLNTEALSFYDVLRKRVSRYNKEELAAASFLHNYDVHPVTFESFSENGVLDCKSLLEYEEGPLQLYIIRVKLLKGDLSLYHPRFFGPSSDRLNLKHEYTQKQLDLVWQFIKSQEGLQAHILEPV